MPVRDQADLVDRVKALQGAVDLATQRLDGTTGVQARTTLEAVTEAMKAPSQVTVIGLAGPTGVGKSSLFNALTGTELSATSVARPTTSAPVAATFTAGAPPSGVLDVEEVHRVEPPPGWQGLVLVDLPDMDSVRTANRQRTDELLDRLDLVLWVVDVEKYADQTVHEAYLRRLADRNVPVQIVVNKVDMLQPQERLALTGDVQARLTADRLGRVHPHPISVRTTEGLEELREMLTQAVDGHRLHLHRLGRHVAEAADRLDPGEDEVMLSAEARHEATAAVMAAVDVDGHAAARERHYRRRARRRTAWPPLRLLRRPRASGRAAAPTADPDGHVRVSLGEVAAQAEAHLPVPWSQAVAATVAAREPILVDHVRRRVARLADEQVTTPLWWNVVGVVQRLLLAVAVLALLWWALGPALLSLLGRPDTDLPGLPGSQAPGLLVALAAVVVGLVVDLGTRVVAGAAARRQAEAYREATRAAVERSIQSEVVGPVDAILADRRTVRDLVRTARGVVDVGEQP